jgi:hypothetical protein
VIRQPPIHHVVNRIPVRHVVDGIPGNRPRTNRTAERKRRRRYTGKDEPDRGQTFFRHARGPVGPSAKKPGRLPASPVRTLTRSRRERRGSIQGRKTGKKIKKKKRKPVINQPPIPRVTWATGSPGTGHGRTGQPNGKVEPVDGEGRVRSRPNFFPARPGVRSAGSTKIRVDYPAAGRRPATATDDSVGFSSVSKR